MGYKKMTKKEFFEFLEDAWLPYTDFEGVLNRLSIAYDEEGDLQDLKYKEDHHEPRKKWAENSRAYSRRIHAKLKERGYYDN